jgi:hypothetical protein
VAPVQLRGGGGGLLSAPGSVHGILPPRLDVDPDRAGQDLAKLVLAIVELLREVLERQAVRRMEGGSLSDDEIERMGQALMRLEQQVTDLAAAFGIERSELQVRLRGGGPTA